MLVGGGFVTGTVPVPDIGAGGGIELTGFVPGTVIGAVTGFVTGTGVFAGFVGGADETGGVVEGTIFVVPGFVGETGTGFVDGTVIMAGVVDAVSCRILQIFL